MQRSDAVVLPNEHAGLRLGLLETLFILSAFLAPVNVRLFKAFTAYDLALIGLAFLLLAGPSPIRWIPPWLSGAAVVLLLAALVSSFRAPYPDQAAGQVGQFAFIFVVQIPVILSLARSRTVIGGAMAAFIVGYLFVVLVSKYSGSGRTPGGRVLPFYNAENPNALGLPTVYLLPFVLYLAREGWRAGHRLLAPIAAAAAAYLMVWALTASASRGSAAASLLSLVTYLAFAHARRFDWRVLARVLGVAVVIAGLVAVVYFTTFFPSTLARRVSESTGAQTRHPVVDNRVALDRAGWRAFLDSPFVGIGLNNFRYVARTYDSAATFHDPHNVWIQFLSQTGIFGAVAFAFMVVRWFALLYSTHRWTIDVSDRALLWAFIAGMLGLIAHSMLAPLLLQRPYWLLIGIGIAATEAIGSGEAAGSTLGRTS